MKSYLLGIITAMILSAAYAYQNTEEIVVKFFFFERIFSQGLWVIIMFSAGAVLMWFISMLSTFETYRSNKNKTKELVRKITELEDERKALLKTLQNLGGIIESPPAAEPEHRVEAAPAIAPCEPKSIEPAENAAEPRKSPLKSSLDSARSFLASLFPKKDDASKKAAEEPELEAAKPEAVCEMCEIDEPDAEPGEDAFREPRGDTIDDAVAAKEDGPEKKETFTV
jgi:uncharacterized integral membrane protein